jgi:hypothetical protein
VRAHRPAGAFTPGDLGECLPSVACGQDGHGGRLGPSSTFSSGLASAPSCHIHVTESSSGSGHAGAQAPHQRSVDAFGPGDATPGSSTTGGGSHAGPEGRRPRCGATKKVTGEEWVALLPGLLGWFGERLLPLPRGEVHKRKDSSG